MGLGLYMGLGYIRGLGFKVRLLFHPPPLIDVLWAGSRR